MARKSKIEGGISRASAILLTTERFGSLLFCSKRVIYEGDRWQSAASLALDNPLASLQVFIAVPRFIMSHKIGGLLLARVLHPDD